ncbi:unnamed protein product [Nyctereutes procyonoides]|uniref:(raccoon dog) hypothetical protein n=1 Tax=Nyctereutes procyonoides TaxID=34880 RepID=A0A811ZYX2_NYCPR|nr:unnamed protein product [Nyctereutes procyonoides]
MKNEFAAVIFFLTRRVQKHGKWRKEAIVRFPEKLSLLLPEKYKNQGILYVDLGCQKHSLWVGSHGRLKHMISLSPSDLFHSSYHAPVLSSFDSITSNFHSGSSLSDEEISKEVGVKPTSVTATPSLWNGHQNHYSLPIQSCCPNQRIKNKPYHPNPVTCVPPPGKHCDRNHWINLHVLALYYLLLICLVLMLRGGRISLTTY